jgi:hypothetical protein
VATDTGWRPLQKPHRAQGADALAATPFSRLAVTQFLSASGDALVTLALAGSLFFSISPNAARGRVALSLVLTIAPFAIVAPFLGPAIDRLQGGRRFILLGTAIGRVLSCVFMAATVHSLLLFPAAFFTLVFSKAHAVAKSALVPAVVASDDELVEANAKLTVGSAVVGLLVAIPGVAILKLFDAAAVLRVAAIVFFAAAIASLRIIPARVDRRPGEAGAGHFHLSFGITLAAGVMGVIRFTAGFLTFLLAFHFRHTRAPSYWYGIVLGASVAGGLLGAAIAPRLRGKVKEEPLVVSSLVFIVVAAFAAAYVGGRGAAALISAVVGLAAAAGKLAFDSLVQRDAHESLHGRSFARFEAGFQLLWVLGALVPVLLHIAAVPGYVVIAVVTAGAAIGYVVFRLRPPSPTEPVTAGP